VRGGGFCNFWQGCRFLQNQRHGLVRDADRLRYFLLAVAGQPEVEDAAVKAALQHPKAAGMSDRAIAKHVGVGHATVSEWRKKLESYVQVGKIAARTAVRKGKTYTINTANIGRRGTGACP